MTRSTPKETDHNRKSSEENGAFNESNLSSAQDKQDVDTGSAAKHKVVKVQPIKRPLSGFYGVYSVDSKGSSTWQSKIRYDNKQHYLGSFATKEAAALAFDRETRERGFADRPLNYDTIEEAKIAVAAAEAEAQLRPVKPKGVKRPELFFFAENRRQIARDTNTKGHALDKLLAEKWKFANHEPYKKLRDQVTRLMAARTDNSTFDSFTKLSQPLLSPGQGAI
jgi:hypothetical protein